MINIGVPRIGGGTFFNIYLFKHVHLASNACVRRWLAQLLRELRVPGSIPDSGMGVHTGVNVCAQMFKPFGLNICAHTRLPGYRVREIRGTPKFIGSHTNLTFSSMYSMNMSFHQIKTF